MVQVALQGSWDESFHRYMSAGLTPCLRALGLVLEGRSGEGDGRSPRAAGTPVPTLASPHGQAQPPTVQSRGREGASQGGWL